MAVQIREWMLQCYILYSAHCTRLTKDHYVMRNLDATRPSAIRDH